MLHFDQGKGQLVAQQQQLTDQQIRKVFHQLGLSGSTHPIAAQPTTPPPSQPIYFPLSADSLAGKKTD